MKDFLSDFLQHLEDNLPEADRPLVTLAYAQSLDGSIALRRGTPLALSNEASLQMTHQLRAWHDAILIGIGTLLSDDPQLNVRYSQGENPQPVVLDSQLRFPLQARLLENSKRPWIFTNRLEDDPKAQLLSRRGCKIFSLKSRGPAQGNLDLMLAQLNEQGIRRLMVEGGARVIESFLRSGHVDALVLTLAPVLVGGLKAVENLPDAGPISGTYPRLREMQSTRLGEDLLIWGRLT